MAKSKTSSKRKKRSELTPQDIVVEAFMGCARCSFFLVGYRLIHDDFDEAVDKSDGGWLTLTWDHAVKQHVHKSYGNEIEMDAYYYQGCCKECRRAFIFEESGGDDQPAIFKIAIKNR